ncbi:hypothetical protein [Emticicia sp. W12TSBA100-4]|uniref:hypothetical protein n=1 Tax=Emticicia sp. W12TSBA100-4 TaxID=3160965 RepID=UPI00330662F1
MKNYVLLFIIIVFTKTVFAQSYTITPNSAKLDNSDSGFPFRIGMKTGRNGYFDFFRGGLVSAGIALTNSPKQLLFGIGNLGNAANSVITIDSATRFVGIRTNAPLAQFHIQDGGNSTVLPFTTRMIIRSDTDADISLVGGANSKGAIYFQGNGSSFTSITGDYNNLSLNSNVGTGITVNSATPKTFVTGKFEVKSSGTSGVTPFSNPLVFIQNTNHNYLHMAASDGFDNAIFFSNPNHNPNFGGGITYKSDDRMIFQTDGTNRMLIGATGRIGINTITPAARLHIFNGNSGVGGTPADELIIENSANNYIQMMNPQTNEAGLLFGLPSSLVSGGIIYNNASSGALDFRTNNNQTQVRINNSGNVGIGTTTPTAKLDVNGTAKIGTNGTVIKEIIRHTHSGVSFSLSANSSIEVNFNISVPNAQPGSAIAVTTSKRLPVGVIQNVSCEVAGEVKVGFYNTTSSAVSLSNFDINIAVIR